MLFRKRLIFRQKSDKIEAYKTKESFMTSNKLKIIACISMAVDHVGVLLFPNIVVLRYIGRIALPLFAYFIAEGCLHTRSKTKYFLQIFALAVACQLFYIGESVISGGIRSLYLNILFTFSLSIAVCSAYLRLMDTIREKNKKRLATDIALLAGALAISVFCCTGLSWLFGIPVTVDYGLVGVLLPLSALIFKDKKWRFLSFSAGTLIYCLIRSFTLSYVWFALLALPLLALYNGERGTKKLKWFFYFFYPLHFAIISGIDLII